MAGKPRAQLTGAEAQHLLDDINLRLDRIGINTQPEIAMKILSLIQSPNAQVLDYARIIKNDAALCGRLLKLANSAYFAQRGCVTSLDRACVLLGLERLRAFALGFHLGRAASSDPTAMVSREVWGQSVYRACLAGELARDLIPSHHTEAFVIGLMLDAGLPLMNRMLGEPFLGIYMQREAPSRMHRDEFDALPFTHVDVAAALARRWKLPELLSSPIRWHHTPPGDSERIDPLSRLHRIAYYVGSLNLEPTEVVPKSPAPMPLIAAKVLGMEIDRLREVVSRSTKEYQNTAQIFADIMQQITDVETLSEQVHVQLITVMDQTLTSSFEACKRDAGRFLIGGFAVEIEPQKDGLASAYLVGSSGERLVSWTFKISLTTAYELTEALGLEQPSPDEAAAVDVYLGKVAA